MGGRVAAALLVVLVAACDHSAPFTVVTQGDVGPFSSVLPRRLTFFPGASRTPSVAGGVIAYSLQSDAEKGDYGPIYGREECLAFLPVEGGTITRALCPDRLIPQPDSFVDTWFDPSVSPDGKRIAFMWQRGFRVSALGFWDAHLTVTSLDDPEDTSGVWREVQWVRPHQPNDLRADVATHITWTDADHLRLLATYEHIFKVKGGGAGRVTDTTWDALALLDIDLRTSVTSLVPGGDSVVAYAVAPDSGLWVVKEADLAAVLHLDPRSGVTVPVGRFSSAVLDLIDVGGAPVAITSAGTAIQRLDPVTMALDSIGGFTGPARRLAAAGGKKFIAEIEQADVLFGAPPALWLFEWTP